LDEKIKLFSKKTFDCIPSPLTNNKFISSKIKTGTFIKIYLRVSQGRALWRLAFIFGRIFGIWRATRKFWRTSRCKSSNVRMVISLTILKILTFEHSPLALVP